MRKNRYSKTRESKEKNGKKLIITGLLTAIGIASTLKMLEANEIGETLFYKAKNALIISINEIVIALLGGRK